MRNKHMVTGYRFAAIITSAFLLGLSYPVSHAETSTPSSTTAANVPNDGSTYEYDPLISDPGMGKDSNNEDKVIGDNYDEMLECLDWLRPSDDPLTMFAAKGGTVIMDCRAARHIIADNHRLPNPPNRVDWHELQTCVARVLTAEDWSGANPPNTGYKYENRLSRVWSYVVVNPQRRVVTAWAGDGDGADWGGCVRGNGFFG